MTDWKNDFPKVLICQPVMVVNQACTQEVYRTEEVSRIKATSRNILATTNKQKDFWVFFTWVLLELQRNLGIFHNKQGDSFQFPKKSIEGLPLLPGSLWQLTYFMICSFQNIWLLFCKEGEIQWAKNDKFYEWTYGSLKNFKHIYLAKK